MLLVEAILVGPVGRMIGVFTGYRLSYRLAYVLSGFIQPQQNTPFRSPETQKMTISPIFSPKWTIIAFVFATVVCIVFGLYPARKA
jgi:ABC-type antimicrobial peptide transport system permease subunit